MQNLIFNENQNKVIKEINENILLLAPAGTGKTNTLSIRIQNIINSNRAPAASILCMTFTNRACKEMKEKIISTLGNKKLNITVKTFHSFCFDILKLESKKNTDINYDFMIFDEDDCKEIIDEFITEKFNTNSIYNFISFIKENEFTSENYEDVIDNLYLSKFKKLTEICVGFDYKTDYRLLDYLRKNGSLILETYDSFLRERHGMDFNDLIIQVYNLFKDDSIAEKWRSKFKYLLIDEMQDTSSIEYNIMSKLFKGNNVMLCGDFFQTIYEWRGSQPKNILTDYIKNFNPVKITFNENYRSSQMLLKGSYSYLKNAFSNEVNNVYEKELEPKSKIPGEKIVIKCAKNIEEEGKWIFNKIKELNVDDISKVAILTRNNKINSSLSRVFASLNSSLSKKDRLDFLLIDQFKFFKRQEIKDILSYLKLIINKSDANSLKRILKRFVKGIGSVTIESIEKEDLFKLGIRLTDFIDINTHKYGDPYQLLIDELNKSNVVVFDVESTGLDTLEDEIIQISAVKINARGDIIDTFEKFLKPSKRVGRSQEIHGFSDEFLKENGEDSKKALQAFLKFADSSLLVGHNVLYDISILESQLSRLSLPPLRFIDYYDTLDIARKFYFEFEDYKLETLSTIFNTNTKSNHNAMDDVLATKDILITMLNEKIVTSISERKAIYSKYLNKFKNLSLDISKLRELSYKLRPHDLIAEIVNISKIKDVYKDEFARIFNVREMYLIGKEMDNVELSSKDALSEFLKMSTLSTSELDRLIKKHPRIPIITIHQAKGSEFDYVFVAGLEDFIFPSYISIKNNSLEEEKRLLYVAITRAKKLLFLTWAKEDGMKSRNESRLISYIDDEFIERI